MLGVCKYFLLETNISLKQVYKTFYPVNSLIRDARWNRSDGLKSSSSYIKQPSVVAKRVIDTVKVGYGHACKICSNLQ